ncbi:hypothetical protein NDK43_25870 [Neobacillus pocheonensis]|uniref:Uncharacterized protein n=1 Tax=Neobacillus pocheonensis TaxID=363869 RepID=A0ABT0WFP8_9BACI|nr:hypothetical protein [Neobacillus pocheonensis]
MYRPMGKDEWEKAYKEASKWKEEQFAQNMDKVRITAESVIEQLLKGKPFK